MIKKLKRTQTFGEELGNGISHGVMALFGIAILIVLLVRSHDASHIAGAIVYGLSVTLLYVFSCIYHVWPNNFVKWKIFKRFDHISIYLLIGGTYSPILLTLPTIQNAVMGSSLTFGELIFMIEWILIAIGITFKAIWLNKFHWIHVIIFLVLGWSAMFFIQQIYSFDVGFFWMIVTGGLCYTVGVIFYAISQVKWFHFTWHFFTIFGTVLHAIAILIYLY
ncbi:MAG: hemolysin III family protein [Mycoplasmataceae bacterium]|nr:hemolysin III family protein [Mycoplasmataceae bacterium]